MEQRNRVVEGMQEWLQREDNVSKLFSPATLRTKYFQELKLDYLRELRRQIRPDATKDERMTLRILKGEMKQMERALYPSRIERMIRSLYSAIRNSLDKKPRASLGEKTTWMMKVVTNDRSKNNSKDRVQPVRQQRQQPPQLVVKKRTSQDKGLKM